MMYVSWQCILCCPSEEFSTLLLFGVFIESKLMFCFEVLLVGVEAYIDNDVVVQMTWT